MRHLGLEVHRLEKLMARRRGYSAAHQDADRQTGMHGICFAICTKIRNGTCSSGTLKRRFPLAVPR